jgi:DNA-binding response OmpR family regulator
MDVRKSVLSISYDRDRLDTRNEILRREGYAVVSTSDLGHALELAEGADAVIVGDSIPDPEKKVFLSGLKKKKQIPVLVLHSTFVSGVTADASLHILDGPAKLLEELRDLLASRK